MKEYFVYWVKHEIYFRYFYKSDILYRFFLSSQVENTVYVQEQLDYITNDFPPNASLHQDENVYIEADQHYLRVVCDSLTTAEETIFSELRHFDSSFFIIEPAASNCGWIAPIIKNDLQSQVHLLYSSF
ncbi:sporulation inhibitor of replication protein SirA [Terribacillus saccharophilus]|uniref:sporulation inhibitor of replication protein SirA n=1 Tax=Terribacillus saccharophilus TaxID=361277 RepID=UPI0039820B70